MPYETNEEFFAGLRELIDTWCEHRSLRPLARILGPFLSFNGMTDGWHEIASGLKSIRAQNRGDLSVKELAAVDDLIRATDKAIYKG
jgi:hypothetical protein